MTPIARRATWIWLALGVFLVATVLGTPLAARRLASGRAQAWASPRPPRRVRFAVVGRGNAEAGTLAARRIEPRPRRRPSRSPVSTLSQSLVRRLPGAPSHATPARSIRLRC